MKNINLDTLALIGMTSSSLVHEIKTPLSVISMVSENMKDSLGDGPESIILDKLIDKIISATEEIETIILSTQKLLRGEKDTFIKRNIKDIIQKSIESCKSNCRIILEIENIEINCNPDLLKQLFVILINNSTDEIKDHQDKFIKISCEDNSENITINFSDSGKIDPNLFTKIFKPLVSSKGSEGTGIGLYLAEKIMSFHNGSIICEHLNNQTNFKLVFNKC